MRAGSGVQAHSAMVTCVDALEPAAIVSSGMEGTVHRWDFRKLATQVSARTRKMAGGSSAEFSCIYARLCYLQKRKSSLQDGRSLVLQNDFQL